MVLSFGGSHYCRTQRNGDAWIKDNKKLDSNLSGTELERYLFPKLINRGFGTLISYCEINVYNEKNAYDLFSGRRGQIGYGHYTKMTFLTSEIKWQLILNVNHYFFYKYYSCV